MRHKRKSGHTQGTPKQSSQQMELLELSFFSLSTRDSLKRSPVGHRSQKNLAFMHSHSITCHKASLQEAGAASFGIQVLYDARKTFLSPLLLSSHQLHGTLTRRLQDIQKTHYSRAISLFGSQCPHLAEVVNGISISYPTHF